MPDIVLSDVSKIRRDGSAVIDAVTFTVSEGAFCTLLGPTGCGKSTLLRLIASREPVTSGEIEIGDSAHQSWRLGRPELVELVDPATLDPARNLYDNIVAGLGKRGLKRKDVEQRALRAADTLELGALLARPAGRVSTGERSLAALARAFAHQPRALLFDEPLAGLDPRRRIATLRALKTLQRESGVAVIYATHDWTDALAVADVVAVMDRGRVVATGTPAEIYHRPANSALAGLVGAPPMNLLPVRANQTGLSLEDGTHLGAASVMTTAVHGWLGVRPERLFPADDAPAPAAVFPMDVEAAESGGPETRLYGKVGAYPFAATLRERATVEPGGRLRLAARREDLHMFSVPDGARM